MKDTPPNKKLNAHFSRFPTGHTVRRMRKCAHVSQGKLGQVLGLHQTAICRIENGLQGLSTEEWKKLSHYFQMKIDDILKGSVNYWGIAEKFGCKPPFPRRYLEHPHSTVREVLPLLQFLNKTKGHTFTSQVFRELDIDNFLFLSPDQTIGARCHLDLFRYAIERKLITARSFSTLINHTRNTEVHGFLDHTYKIQNSSLSLIQTLILNSAHYESNFDHQIEEMKKNSLTLSVTPNPHMEQIPYKDDVLGDFLCRYKKDYLAEFPLYINNKPVLLTEKDCHFRGDAQCIYQVTAA